jgi:hypothetical protein
MLTESLRAGGLHNIGGIFAFVEIHDYYDHRVTRSIGILLHA